MRLRMRNHRRAIVVSTTSMRAYRGQCSLFKLMLSTVKVFLVRYTNFTVLDKQDGFKSLVVKLNKLKTDCSCESIAIGDHFYPHIMNNFVCKENYIHKRRTNKKVSIESW